MRLAHSLEKGFARHAISSKYAVVGLRPRRARAASSLQIIFKRAHSPPYSLRSELVEIKRHSLVMGVGAVSRLSVLLCAFAEAFGFEHCSASKYISTFSLMR